MSQGTSEKKPEKGSVSSETARTWCEEARVILGRFGIAGDAKQLKQASENVLKQLTKAEELFPNVEDMPKGIQDNREKFVELAWELKQAENDYRKFETEENEARSKYYKRVGRNDKKNEVIFKPIEEKAKVSKENARAKLLRLKDELLLLQGDLTGQVSTEVEKVKRKESSVTDKNEKKLISDGQSEEKKAEELIAHFQQNYDKETAKSIAEEFEKYEATHGDWYEPKTTRAEKKAAIVEFNRKWNDEKQSFADGKKAYEKAIKEVRELTVQVEEMISVDDRKTLMEIYYEAQDAEIERNWKLAGSQVNAEFAEELRTYVSQNLAEYEKWLQLKAEKYLELKHKLEALEDSHFMLMGLELLAAAVAIADNDRDYPKAREMFRKATLFGEEIVEVAELAKVKLAEFQVVANESQLAYDNLPVEAKGVAAGLPQSIKDAIDKFRENIHVRSLEEFQVVVKECATTIIALRDEIEGYGDTQKVDAKKQELAEKKDLTPFVQGLQAAIQTARDAIFKYEGIGYDSANPAEIGKIATWKASIETVEKYLVGLTRAANKGNVDNFQYHADTYDKHIQALSALENEVATSTGVAENAVPALKTQLQQNIKELKIVLDDTRWFTLREATWHTSASEELTFFGMASKTESITVLNDLISRSRKLIDTADKAFSYYLAWETGVEIPDFRYNELKNRMEGLVKQLSKKALRQDVPTERERLLTEVTDLQQEIRQGGPGLIEEKFDEFDQNVGELETQVNDLIARQGRIATLRTLLREKAGKIKNMINVELVEQFNLLTDSDLHPDFLPISQKLEQIEAGLLAESEDDVAAQGKRLDNLELEVQFLLDEGRTLLGKRTTTGFSLEKEASGEYLELSKIAKKAETDERNRVGAILELRAKYDNTLRDYEEAYARVKKISDVDKSELKRIRDLYKQALKSTKKPQEDYAAALRQIDLALRMTLQLEKDPLASQTTERGRSHLKELNPRWTNAISVLTNSLEGLSNVIHETAKADTTIDWADKLKSTFDDVVVSRIKKELNAGDFQQELLVLGAEDPSDKAEKEKMQAKKRKIREQALVKIRRYMAVIGRDPVFTSLIFEGNPWSTRKGAVSGLPLMRALNDLDLNIQRAV